MPVWKMDKSIIKWVLSLFKCFCDPGPRFKVMD